jgi:hypothetical protein
VKDAQHWGPPGWPWELELFALVFVITAIAVPVYLQSMQVPEPAQLSLMAQAQMAKGQSVTTWQGLGGLYWAVIILGLYFAHLAAARASIDFMSTPFTHLFTPLLFSMITYYRLYVPTEGPMLTTPIVSGNPVEVLIWAMGVLIITFLLARIRMARLMLNFRDVDWAFSTPSLFDSTFLRLMLRIRPLIYAPRLIRVCPSGIVIEGWFYAMPIPFDSMHAMDAVHGAAFISSGYCLATSMKALVRIQVTEKAEPILISPKDRATFLKYCQPHVAIKRPSTRPGETQAGVAASALRKGF